jgi:hypothetical protein
MIILPEFYETNLKRELGRAEYLLLKILINLLQSIKTVSVEALATALPTGRTHEISETLAR